MEESRPIRCFPRYSKAILNSAAAVVPRDRPTLLVSQAKGGVAGWRIAVTRWHMAVPDALALATILFPRGVVGGSRLQCSVPPGSLLAVAYFVC